MTARTIITAMFSGKVAANAVRVALVVGSVLNAINQGAGIWHGDGVEWGKFALNYAVPFLVSSYSAAKIAVGAADATSGGDEL